MQRQMISKTFVFPTDTNLTIHALIDSGAEMSLLQEKFVPKQLWLPLDKPARLQDFMGRPVMVTHKAHLPLVIKDIHNTPHHYTFDFALLPIEFDVDCLIGMNNLGHYLPFNTHYFTFDNLQIPRVPFPIHLANSFTPAQRGVSLLDHKTISYTIPIHSNSEEIIHSLLQPLYSDNPLLHFDKSPRYCSLNLLEQYQNTKIRTNSIMVSPSDKEKFAI